MAKTYTQKERDYIYDQLINKLIELNMIDSDLESIKKLKIIAKLYKDTGMEFQGELPLNKKITYEFYNNHRKKTNVNISQGINRKITTKEREAYYDEFMETLKKLDLHESKGKGVKRLKNKMSEYKTTGTEFKDELALPNKKKLICELYNDYKHESIIKIIGEDNICSKNNRQKTYDEIMTSLNKMDLLNLQLDGIEKFS